jgi:hypothetical protein
MQLLELGDMISSAHLTGTKTGNAAYQKWKNGMQRKFEEIEKEEHMTVFDRLKQKAQPNTLFTRFKRLKSGV